MATDWAADVRKYAADADDAAIAGIVRYCGIALRNRDSAMIAFSDKTETDRVRTNFLQKKLALPHPQSELDAAIAKVGAAMKGDRTKNRVTVYYLLAQEFDQLAMFVSKTAGKTASKAASALPLAAAAAAPKPAAKVAPKPAAKVPAAKPVNAVPAVKPAAKAAKAAKAPAAAVGAAAAIAAAKPAKTAAAKPAATKPAAVKTAIVKAPVKAAAAKPAAKQAAVTTKKSAPTKAAVSTEAAAPAEAKAETSAPAGTIAATTALGGAPIAAAAGGAETVKDAAAKVADLVTDTESRTVVPSGSAPAVAAPAAAAPAAASPKVATPAATSSDDDSGLGWLYWVLGGLVLLALLWFLFNRGPADDTVAAAVPTEAAAVAVPLQTPAFEVAAGDLAAAPAEGSGSVQIPTGAGVTSELRGDKPVVKVYFDTGKTDLAGAFAGAAGGLKSYLSAHPGTVLNVSGYSDPSGNAAANAELSKNRAKAVQTALVAAGIPEASAMLVKPDNSADASVPKDAARRVEVVVK